MSPLASLKHQAEKDLSVPTGWKKSRQSQTATTRKGLGKFLVIRSGSVDKNLMSTVMEIEKAIEKLPPDELFELTHWISSRFSDEWDRQIEIDISSGRLDDLAAEALQEYRAGGSREFPLDEQ
jgi:hypothetical protein